jgi:CTP:molybdopterin cytidylyltransferase MocA
VAGIRALPSSDGINSYLRGVASATLEVTVTDAGILANLDTPEDYGRLRAK